MSRASQHCANRDDWETPPWLWDALNDEFRFRLDAAASDQNAKCAEYFTAEDDALESDWGFGVGGWAFCNPPYSRKREFLQHYLDIESEGVSAVFVLPASVGDLWFHELVFGRASDIYIVRGRVQFLLNGERSKSGNTGGTAIAIYDCGMRPDPRTKPTRRKPGPWEVIRRS